jgi:hypothetical protein
MPIWGIPHIRRENLKISMVAHLVGPVPCRSEALSSLACLIHMEIIPETIGLTHIGLSMEEVDKIDF